MILPPGIFIKFSVNWFCKEESIKFVRLFYEVAVLINVNETCLRLNPYELIEPPVIVSVKLLIPELAIIFIIIILIFEALKSDKFVEIELNTCELK